MCDKTEFNPDYSVADVIKDMETENYNLTKALEEAEKLIKQQTQRIRVLQSRIIGMKKRIKSHT